MPGNELFKKAMKDGEPTDATVKPNPSVRRADWPESNILVFRSQECGIYIPPEMHQRVAVTMTQAEEAGAQFHQARASLCLFLWRETGVLPNFFEILQARVVNSIIDGIKSQAQAKAILKVNINGHTERCVCEASSTIEALDDALRYALIKKHPEIRAVAPVDHSISLVRPGQIADKRVRVRITFTDGDSRYVVQGIDVNLEKALLQALCEAYQYRIFRYRQATC